MRIAERARVGVLMIGGAVALAGLASLTIDTSNTPEPPIQITGCKMAAAPRLVGDPCPAFARAKLRVDDAAILTCVRGDFGEIGYFLHAQYKTSEWWTRSALVTEDGTRLLSPLEDSPSLLRADGDMLSLTLVDHGSRHAISLGTRNRHRAMSLTLAPERGALHTAASFTTPCGTEDEDRALCSSFYDYELRDGAVVVR